MADRPKITSVPGPKAAPASAPPANSDPNPPVATPRDAGVVSLPAARPNAGK